jgi:hypothetical protein
MLPKLNYVAALGIGALYSSAVVEECCQAAENIVKRQTCGSMTNQLPLYTG